MENQIGEMAAGFSNMGVFSEAFGMNTLSIGTLNGYFATEIGTIHGLGSGMFAAMLGCTMLSKEEDAHTGEFLYSLPLSRRKIVCAKSFAIAANIVAFSVNCAVLYLMGFVILEESIAGERFAQFMLMQCLMNLEIGFICMMISAFCKKNKLGLGLGVALILYVYDIVGRVIPDMKDTLFVGPYSYANATAILAGEDFPKKAVILGIAVTISMIIIAFGEILKRDLSS
jgi:ABC-2 type transport system permease protein